MVHANITQTLLDIANQLRTSIPATLTTITLHISNTAHLTLEELDMTTPPIDKATINP